MRKYVFISIAVAALFAGTVPVGAETGFNQMSKCIQSWGKGCGECKGSQAQAAAPVKSKRCCVKTTDTLGNKVDTGTNNSGKTRLGV